MKNALWLHFIDNTSAQYSLVRGSSSVQSGDHVIGLTWQMSAQLGTYPYYDRVHTKSNPIDGVSRGDFTGPWGRVYTAKLPINAILQCFRDATNSGAPVQSSLSSVPSAVAFAWVGCLVLVLLRPLSEYRGASSPLR